MNHTGLEVEMRQDSIGHEAGVTLPSMITPSSSKIITPLTSTNAVNTPATGTQNANTPQHISENGKDPNKELVDMKT